MRRAETGIRGATTARLVALGGGKGGAGRSTLAAELARALARRDRRVLVVDVDGRARTQATLLKCDPAPDPARLQELEASTPLAAASATEHPQVSMLALSALTAAPQGQRLRLVRDLLHWLRGAAVDWVVLDLPAGFEAAHIALFTGTDIPLLVSQPEPVSLVATSEYLRACLLHALAHHPEGGARLREQLRGAVRLLRGQWRFATLEAALDDDEARGLLRETCQSLVVGVVLNQIREGSETDQAQALTHAWAMELGVWPRVMGAVQHDERRWFFARRLAPPISHPREDSVVGDIDQLARDLVGLDAVQWSQPRACLPLIDPRALPRIFLDLDDATASEARQRYRRLWEGYRREAGMVSFILDPETRREALEQLDGAYRRLTMSLNETPPPRGSAPTSGGGGGGHPHHHPGQVIRLARMRAGLGLRELSLRTRVGVKHIEAIEMMNRRELPDRVYLKAYLSEVAKSLGLEPEAIVDDYMKGLRLRSR